LDLCLSGRAAGGFPKGKYIWMVGDSSSGKTWLMLTCLAEASINANFDSYRFIYDNGEDGALMDMEKYFGPKMVERLEPPAYDTEDKPFYSVDVEDFYYNLDDALDDAEKPKGKPFIYLLDSMDSLDSRYSDKKFQEAKKAHRGNKEAKGDYGDGKAKINSTRLRRVVSRLSATGSILVILSQTRDKIDAGMFEEKQTFAGGHALKFYAAVQLWSSVGTRIKKTIKGRDVVVGITCRVKTKKNRLTGKERTAEFPIYYDTGIDDLGGMIDFMAYWGHWPRNKQGVIDAKDFCVQLKKEELVAWIEEKDMREDLELIVEDAWNEVESKVAIKRKSKYE
jgi:RecA/RadA recombinase